MNIDPTKAQQFLTQALSSLGNDPNYSIARHQISQALSQIDSAQKRQRRFGKKTTQSEWWSNIVSGTTSLAFSPMSAQATARSLKELNQMIQHQQKQIDDLQAELESKNQSPNQPEVKNLLG
jgi:Tfp pilus assembly protein FimV